MGEATDNTTDAARTAQARVIVRRHAYWALGLGLLPLPIVDVVALTGLQVKLLAALSAHYGVTFSAERARAAVVALTAGLGSVAVSGMIASSLFKIVPVAGIVAGIVGVPLLGGALTRAVGDLFVMHFESGGTLLDFDAVAMRGHFREEFERARAEVTRTRAGDEEPVAP